MATPSRISYGNKLFLIGLIGAVLMITSYVVWGFVDSREETSENTSGAIARAWGAEYRLGDVGIAGDSGIIAVRPSDYRCTATIDTRRLHRGIYEAEVYDARLRLSGTIAAPADSDSTCRFVIRADRPGASLGMLTFNGLRYAMLENGDEGTYEASLPSESGDFCIDLSVKGSESIRIKMAGRHNDIVIEGDSRNPSFARSGDFPLPEERNLTDEHFSATWNGGYRQGDAGYARVDFLVGVDRYRKVERSLKYAFLFIFFTFLSVFFAERTTRYPIPLLNYLLIGLALILFYVLLLSVCEHTSFGSAYFIASAMTIVLISAYMWGMLRSLKVAAAILAILTLMYAACYVMLCLDAYALLMGTLMLFAALAASMYASLKIKI